MVIYILGVGPKIEPSHAQILSLAPPSEKLTSRHCLPHIFHLSLGLLNRSTNFIQLPPRRIKNLICEETLIRDLTVQAKITPNTVRKRLRIRKMDETTCVIKFMSNTEV